MRVAVVIFASRGSAVAESLVAEVEAAGLEVLRADSPTQARVILRYSGGSGRLDMAARSSGVPQDDESSASTSISKSADRRDCATYAVLVQDAFALAAERGFTHAITLDVDRRHLPTDLPAFMAAIERSPDAIITGHRKLPPGRLPVPVRWARFHGDVWTACAAGRWTQDVGFGYRAYPLAAVVDLTMRSSGREFDIEILAKSIWAGVKTVQIPIAIAADSRAQLMSPAEFVRYGRVITSLIVQRLLLPTPLLASMHRRAVGELPWRKRVMRVMKETIAHHCDRPPTFAAAVGLGMFFGIAPVWGFQMLLAAATAHGLRLSKRVAVAASAISSPLTIPLILYASLLIGHGLHRGQFTHLPRPEQMSRSAMLPYLGEYVLGSVVLAGAAGLLGMTLAYAVATVVKRAGLAKTPTGN